MKFARFEKEKANPAHGGTILAMDVLPSGVEAPFGHAWGYLPAGDEMEGHRHPTEEVYFFFRGTGTVVIDDEERAMEPGEVVHIPPDAYHTVRNDSAGELYWFALWWEPMA